MGLRPALQDTYATQVGIRGVSALNRCQVENCVSFKPPLTSAEFGSLNDSLKEQADDIREVVRAYGKHRDGHYGFNSRDFSADHGLDTNVVNLLIRTAKACWLKDNNDVDFKGVILKSPEHFVKAYLNQRSSDKSTAGKLSYKAKEIAMLVNEPVTPVDRAGRIREYGEGEFALSVGNRIRGVVVRIR